MSKQRTIHYFYSIYYNTKTACGLSTAGRSWEHNASSRRINCKRCLRTKAYLEDLKEEEAVFQPVGPNLSIRITTKGNPEETLKIGRQGS